VPSGTQRNKIAVAGRTGFVRLALRSGVPVIPVVAHGAHHAVTVLARGDRLARAIGLHRVRIKVFPLLAGPPFGVNSVLTPPLPMPAHITLEFLPALDWTAFGPGAADDAGLVSACYLQITGQMQAAPGPPVTWRSWPSLSASAVSQNLARTALATSSGLRSISASP
jgi:hypothetical protein